METSAVVDIVKRSNSASTWDRFEERVSEQAERLRSEVADGEFENSDYTIGLELEAYVVDGDGRLTEVPESLFNVDGCTKEIGRHNLEINTPASGLDPTGIETQASRLRSIAADVRDALADRELVLDAMWTLPPTVGTGAYYGEVDVQEGITIASHMRTSPRYYAIDNDILAHRNGTISLDVPGVEREFPTILPVSLTTSMQPHLQVPDSRQFAAHYNVGIRTLGPVLALTTNSPFLPHDLYDEVDDPLQLVDRTPHELRIEVFEQTINVESPGKVRVPRDLSEPDDIIDSLLADRTCAPFLKEWVKDADAIDEYADRIWELNHKRSTFWRWLRAVPGGEALSGVGEQSLRIEYRPLPTQPTLEAVIGVQRFIVGLLRGLVETGHPVAELSWETARSNFYRAVDSGISAEMRWIRSDGNPTTEPAEIYPELFSVARQGLQSVGLDDSEIERSFAPLRSRVDTGITPSAWKKDRVRHHLERGRSLSTAIRRMQATYRDLSGTGVPITEW